MSKKLNIAFAGFRHGHIYALLDLARKNEDIEVVGAWEDYEPDKNTAITEHNVEFNYNTYNDI